MELNLLRILVRRMRRERLRAPNHLGPPVRVAVDRRSRQQLPRDGHDVAHAALQDHAILDDVFRQASHLSGSQCRQRRPVVKRQPHFRRGLAELLTAR